MQAFLTTLVYDSCQNRCASASDCNAVRIGSTCGVCDVVLYAYTDEEVTEAALAFDRDFCDGNGTFWPLPDEVACVDGVCVRAAP
jgi:hypothetical protein